jgi:hypothetical protein
VIKDEVLMRFFLLLLVSCFLCAEEPKSLYLSWLKDPATSMTIQWHTSPKDRESQIFYQKEGSHDWQTVLGGSLLCANGGICVHRIDLQDLMPNSVYHFKIGSEEKLYKFRTCPQDQEKPLKFVVAGDAYFYLYLLRKMNEQIAKSDPDFVVLGGDIAYVQGHKTFFKGKDWEEKRWTTFFKEWSKQMIAPDGRLIPLVIVVGNHDVQSKKKNMSFYSLFSFPEEGVSYRVLDFGSYFSLFLLDTGHTHPIDGEQKNWLETELAARKDTPFKIATYHVAAYPSVYSYESKIPTKIREEWVPLFEKYGIQFAFENHNHAYKRTHPLKNGKIDPKGVFYLGDGAWGVSPRKPRSPQAWYLANVAQKNCFWMITLDKERCSVQALGKDGKVFDQVPNE